MCVTVSLHTLSHCSLSNGDNSYENDLGDDDVCLPIGQPGKRRIARGKGSLSTEASDVYQRVFLAWCRLFVQ